MKLGFIRLVTLGSALLVAGCMDGSSPTDLSPDLVIFDAEHGDDGSHFYFLPPMVPDPGATGVFDATLPAVVEICELIGVGPNCAATIVEFSVGAGTIDVSGDHYHANWHAGDFNLDLTQLYRISVFVGAQELGFADVQPVANGGGLKNVETGVVIGLVDNRTLPIKFRIEEGARVGSLKVIKNSDADGGFGFTGSGTIGGFTLNTTGAPAATAMQMFGLDPQVTYTVTESLNPNFDLASASCTLEDGTVTGTAGGTAVTGIVIEPAKTTTCTFTNTLKPGSLKVIKNSDQDGSFEFTGSGGVSSFTLNTTGAPAATAMQTFTGLDATVNIDLTETLNPAFDFVSAVCATEGGIPTGAGGPAVTGIDIEPGKTTTCTFTNTRSGITIDATAVTASTFSIGGIGSFPSDTPKVLDLAPGLYTVQESSGGVHDFEITATGLVSYAASKEPFFDGLGTSQLTLVGYSVDIDATAMTAGQYAIGGLGLSQCNRGYVHLLARREDCSGAFRRRA